MVVNHRAKAADAVAGEMIARIIDCASWGAGPAGTLTKLEGTTRKIVVHHTGEPRHLTPDLSREHAVKLAQEIQKDHQERNGWPDSGQHFTVSRGGHVLEGRLGSLETLKTGQAQMSAAHCPGRNHDSIGIENEGYYIEQSPTPELWESLVHLCVTICRQYHLKAHDIFGHMDFRSTQCPGIAFYRQLPRLRREVAATLGTQTGQIPERTWPDIHQVIGTGMQQSGPVVTAAQYLLRNAGYQIALSNGGEWSAEMTPVIKNWQEKHGLTVSADGTMTAETWETLAPELNEDAAPAEAVRAVKHLLREKGYCREILAVDDKFDAVTKHVVKDVQKLHGLPANSIVDTRTWCALTGGIVREAFKDPRPQGV